MNNKGVTLIELLIVIVVLGIISAFAIPAVGSIIENTQRGAVYNDALQMENAAKLYCTENPTAVECGGTGSLTYADDLSGYIDGFDADSYDTMTATYDGSVWVVVLDVTTIVEGTTSDYEWVGTSDAPSNLSKDTVSDTVE
ncbi:MAG: prepilin-type N-terminal cleavage/methylation domain-containing protein [Candidatus Izimaplasma sp.]|nr:prepilin-type N-terminal cleavage/methylation domain-containing protein [Candidatus Izimaplasma bacterium]